MGRRTEFDHQKLPRIVETDRYRMLSKPCTDKHRAFAALESAAAIRRKKEILRAGQPVILAKAQDPPMIMSGQNKVRTPGKIRISIFRVMCQKNMYPRHERCPEKFFQLCEHDELSVWDGLSDQQQADRAVSDLCGPHIPGVGHIQHR